MKCRLLNDTNQRIVLLCKDGTIATANDLLLLDLLTGFQSEGDFFTGKDGRWDEQYPEMSMYPGKTLAIITDTNQLVLDEFELFLPLLKTTTKMRGYISTIDFAKKYDKSPEIIKVYCRKGRIPGAIKIARNWLIPENASYPVDEENRREGVRGPRPHMRKPRPKKDVE